MNSNTIIIICGPTAVGKTALSLDVATQLQTQIISADSRQCFNELNIGVAKPTAEELETITHHFINSNSIFDKNVDAAYFEKYALERVNDIFKQNAVALMAGGTGLYIKAFTEGLDEIPNVEETLRNQLNNEYKTNGLEWLQQKVKEKDPLFWESCEQKNPQRLLRGLEVIESTGKSILNYRKATGKIRPFKMIKAGIEIPRNMLNDKINERVDIMIKEGLVDEVYNLLPYRHYNALQTVGYREIFEYLDGRCTLEEAIEAIKINTRQYAKRQMTWFKKDKTVQWFSPESFQKSWQTLL